MILQFPKEAYQTIYQQNLQKIYVVYGICVSELNFFGIRSIATFSSRV